MRLGQLARKYDLPIQEIIDYLEDELKMDEQFHANYKLATETEQEIFKRFDLRIKEIELHDKSDRIDEQSSQELIEDKVAEIPSPAESIAEDGQIEHSSLTPLDDIASVEGEIEPHQVNLESPVESIETKEVEEKVSDPIPQTEGQVIQTDKLLEMLESEETSTDLEKIRLIKAPKRELSGLKVVGKVDLPEPKKKDEVKEEKESEFVTEKDLKAYRNPRKKKQPLSEEEKEKRRLRAKRKQEEYEARKEKRLKEKEDQERKARKEAHYKQKLEQVSAAKVKRKSKEQTPAIVESNEKRPVPKTLLGKFWRWMNT